MLKSLSAIAQKQEESNATDILQTIITAKKVKLRRNASGNSLIPNSRRPTHPCKESLKLEIYYMNRAISSLYSRLSVLDDRDVLPPQLLGDNTDTVGGRM